MKKQLVLTLCLLITILLAIKTQAQQSDFLSRTTLEAGLGYHRPTAPSDNITTSDFAGFKSFYAGALYEIDELWGLRATYAYNAFEHKDEKATGLKIHKVVAEVTLNIISTIQQQTSTPFEVMAHAGLGLSLGKSEIKSGSDMMGNIQMGIMPKYHISEQWSLLVDASYVLNFSQDYGYQGAAAQISGKSAIGGYFLANLGVAYKLN
ncbi:hypothetical protein [Flavobacterium sp. NKUCC04_CG]|uniref:hypothetical protein n=1 Tax=Flavobacterium sp. NKUCC04_CG TaxID=2842121 RepID=UPI001C5BCBA1|nr:hypothetical protein [Flavobacterium sp. NKUCC04_CG]MBW3517572.1 hypothetical protein [Flavobacterium sp. NKUCC04_CG]